MSDAKPFTIPEEEFEEEYVRPSSGPGGQHQNKTENGVRLQWNIASTAVLTDAQKERRLKEKAVRSRIKALRSGRDSGD